MGSTVPAQPEPTGLSGSSSGRLARKPCGLAASDPELRPADILTRATCQTGETALDVMIKSPYAQDAGDNPTARGVERKMKRYQAISRELADLGITYKPFVYSSLGAPDPGGNRHAHHRGTKTIPGTQSRSTMGLSFNGGGLGSP